MQDSWSDRLSAYLDNEMADDERLELENHLTGCESCQTILVELKAVTSWTTQFPGREPRSDVWPEIQAGMAEGPEFGPAGDRSGTFWGAIAAGLAALLPLGTGAMASMIKNGLIVGLVGVSVFGMGRSLALQRNADMMEQKAGALDRQLSQSAPTVDWATSARELDGGSGVRYAVACEAQSPFDRQDHTVWGSRYYTDDSSICTAAVHAGVISFDEGGFVTIELQAGLQAYEATDRNGISSRPWGSWERSFSVVSAGVLENPDGSDRFNFYFDFDDQGDANEGSINVGREGDVLRFRRSQMEMAREQLEQARELMEAQREELEQLGEIRTQQLEEVSQGELVGQYDQLLAERARLLSARERLLDISPTGDIDERTVDLLRGAREGVSRIRMDLDPETIGWGAGAVSMRGWNGSIIAFECPANGEISSVWGSAVYTDDSSICSAGVHAGLITRQDGGRLVIQIAGGLDDYQASESNGVDSGDWGEFHGSFFFPRALNR